jgi:hypothetical protein
MRTATGMTPEIAQARAGETFEFAKRANEKQNNAGRVDSRTPAGCVMYNTFTMFHTYENAVKDPNNRQIQGS